MKCFGPEEIFLGGTFDPPHLGHRSLLELAMNRFGNAHFFICPAHEPPSTVLDKKKTKASFDDRLAMCRLNFPLGERVSVSDFERNLPAPSYTFNTLKAWRVGSSKRLGILVGADQIQNFVHWRSPKEILALAALIISPRHGFSLIREDVLSVLRKLDESAKWDASQERFVGDQLTGGGVYLLEETPQAGASREIRQRFLEQDQRVNDDALSQDVAVYIKTHNLYR